MTQSAYAQLESTFTRLYRYQHLSALANWDQAAMMPPAGNEARAAAMAELDVLIHNTLTDPVVGSCLAAAAQEGLDEARAASLREMHRQWQQASVLPSRFVEERSLAATRCEHAWRKQRADNDWPGFVANFRSVVRLAREEARLRADATGLSPYDALMDKFEPGSRSAEIEGIFGEVKSWLPDMIRRAVRKQAGEAVIAAQGPFPVDGQRALGVDLMKLVGFDFEAGRLDMSTHPFCGGVAEDVRITTRYSEDDFLQGMMGVLHETGHARYEQNLPRDWVHLPVGQARSMGIHESQSLSFEMQLARSPAFVGLIAPRIRQHLGEQAAFAADNLILMCTRVQPGYIRVFADELTYPMHVILRFEIERALIDGGIEVEDVPALWSEKMADYLGMDTRGNFRDGCLQDIHWPLGIFGYFPSYTLGAMYAAQYFATIRSRHPDFDARIASGDLAVLFDWLRANVWSQASHWPTAELVRRATGQSLDAAHFKAHLERRYL
jgi:carboxypeptidase Taq